MILDRYLARRFARTLLSTFGAIFLVLTLVGLIEHIRRFGDQTEGLGGVVALTLLAIPSELHMALPLVAILGAIVLFLGLARSSELVVVRGSGRSALRALLGPGLVALMAGALAAGILNPIVAATSREYEARLDRLSGRGSTLALADEGLWLRQGGPEGQAVIRARGANLDGTLLRGVSFLLLDAEGRPRERVDAAEARLGDGAWLLRDAKSWPLEARNPEAAARLHPTLALPSTLTADEIRNSFGAPSAIPIWELPRFIARLEEAGFAARRHLTYLHMELAQPVLLLAMTLIAAVFTMHHPRGRRTGVLALLAVLTGFAVWVLRNVSQVLGETGQIPPALAAWAPPVAAVLLALAMLLQQEET